MQEAQMLANQQVEAIAIAVGALFGGKSSSDKPAETYDQLQSGLTALFRG